MKKPRKTATRLTRVEKFRQWVKNLATNTFSGPYLPVAFTIFFVTTVLTNLAIILMSQPLSYWQNSGKAVGIGIFGEPLMAGPWTLAAWTIGYLIVAILLLGFVNYRWSLVGWITAEFAHLYFIQETLSDCYISRWSVPLGEFCQAIDALGIWFFAAILMGILLVFSFQPAEFPLAKTRVKKAALGVLGMLPIAWILFLAGAVIFSAQKPSFGWVPLEVDHKPGPLQDAEAAYDSKRGVAVIFGGASGYLGDMQWAYQDGTWEWDGNAWRQMSPQESPAGRIDHAIVYDEKRSLVFLFGGYGADGYMSDTWEWDGAAWAQKDPAISPPARSGHEMYYDPARNRVVLYGGYDGSIFYNDAWEWNGRNWREIVLAENEPVVNVYALAYDPVAEYALGLLNNGTWRWENHHWTQLFPDNEPSHRISSTVVFDPEREVFFTFGGVSSNQTLDDTWTFDGEAWSMYTKGGIHPSDRSDMTIWYDPNREAILLFGGRNSTTVFNDMWEFIAPED